jgi:hypothetical protein
MSMKRTKQKSTRREKDVPTAGMKGKAEPEKSWDEQVASQPDDAFVPYNMQARFTKGAFIAHQTFGKGLVLGVDSERIEVLFSAGKKKLGHGIQPAGAPPAA